MFLFGSVSFRLYQTFLSDNNKHLLIDLISVIACIWITYSYFIGWYYIDGGGYGLQASIGRPYWYWLCLVASTASLPFIFRVSKASKLDRFIGDFSYPMYISHFFCIFIIETYANIPVKYESIAVLCLSITLSLLIRIYIEKPLSRIRQNLKTNKSKSGDVTAYDQRESDTVYA